MSRARRGYRRKPIEAWSDRPRERATAQTGRPANLFDAAVRPVIAVTRCNCEIGKDRIHSLRQMRRLGPPCLRAFHSSSPPDLMPVLSIRRFSGPLPPQYERLTFSVFCRRQSVLKFGAAQSSSTSRSKHSIKPVVCRSGSPNSTFKVRHACIAATLLPTALAVWRWRPNHLGVKPTSHTCKHVLPVNGSIAIPGASAPHYNATSSWSCTLFGPNCSYRPAIRLDSKGESFTRFERQSPIKVPSHHSNIA
jgi:hypothetical protein